MDNYSNTTLAKCNPWLDYFRNAMFWAIQSIPSHTSAKQMQICDNIRYIVEDTTSNIDFQVTRHLKEYDFTQ